MAYHRIPVTAPTFTLALAALLGLPGLLCAKPGNHLAPALSQEQEVPTFQLLGQIETEPGVRLKGFFSNVVLRGAYHPFSLQTVSSLGGRFKFLQVPAGTYVLTVTTPRNGFYSRTIAVTYQLC